MASEAPSWADQWGAGGVGAPQAEDDNMNTNKDGSSNKKKDAKAGGFGKAKAVAITGAQKIKMGTSTGIKWVKNQCQKKGSSK